jgi:hypothetical protein
MKNFLKKNFLKSGMFRFFLLIFLSQNIEKKNYKSLRLLDSHQKNLMSTIWIDLILEPFDFPFSDFFPK